MDLPFWHRVAQFFLLTSLFVLVPTMGPRVLDKAYDRVQVALIRRRWRRHKRRPPRACESKPGRFPPC